MSYKVIFKDSARKELYRLPDKTIQRILTAIEGLADEPRPAGVKKLKGKGESLWRIRVGDYRIVYLIEDSIKLIDIRKIGDRKEIYD